MFDSKKNSKYQAYFYWVDPILSLLPLNFAKFEDFYCQKHLVRTVIAFLLKGFNIFILVL